MQVHNPQNLQYTCSTCLTLHPNPQNYKEHYKSDYHRYNIKRKMVKLPPVTLAQFSTKQQQIKNQPNNNLVCNQCRKKFNSVNTLNQHVQSKGHNPNAISEPKTKVVKAAPLFTKDSKRCIFCSVIHPTLQLNLEHMSSVHSFFIGQIEYCKNIGGLIQYFQEKIDVGHMCIMCENKGVRDFQSGDAVRKHMADRGHNFMKTDQGYEEYQQYYDFSPLFDQKLKEQQNIVPGIQFQKIKVIVDQKEDKQSVEKVYEQEWEDDSQDDNDGEEDDGEWENIEEESENEQQHKQGEKKKQKVKTYMIMKPTLTANDELLLPNGKLLGHRKYRHIYKQSISLPMGFTNKLKMLTNSEQCTALTAVNNRRAVMEMIKLQKATNRDTKREKRHALKVDIHHNGLMYYFRCQNPL